MPQKVTYFPGRCIYFMSVTLKPFLFDQYADIIVERIDINIIFR